jgi:predicted AAA+ superfamily ATPase
MYFKRDIAPFIRQTLRGFSSVMITGPRQVGKTTMLKTEFQDFCYVSLDDITVRELACNDPALFLQRYSAPLVVDEIQYAPDLLIYLKVQIDKNPQLKGRYILTGSQKFHLMRGVSESMAGRIAILNMSGLSASELANGKGQIFDPKYLNYSFKSNSGLSETFEKIWKGSFPVLYDGTPIDRTTFYGSYVSTYIERDIRDLNKISDESAFLKFLRALAARTGQLLNIADIARDSDINVKTAESWLSLVETTGLVFLLRPYFANVTNRIIKTPKIYFLDTGLACYLTRWSSPEVLEAGTAGGPMFETYVFCELLKSYWNQGCEAPFYFYRDRDMKEIDLIIERDGVLYPIEIKKTAMPSRTAAKSFRVLEKFGLEIGQGTVICLAEATIPLSRTVTAIPVDAIGRRGV